MENKRPGESEEEYHFTEPPEGPAYEPKRPQTAIFERMNRRKLFIAVGIIVIALALYKLLGTFWGGEVKKATGPTTELIPQPPVPVVQTPAQAIPATVVAPADQLSALQITSDQNKQQINILTNNLSGLANTVTNMQGAIDSINQQLQNITKILENQIQAIKAPVRRVVVERMAPPPPPIFIHAMIPERAWLILPDGTIFTVRVGDRLLGYGRITRISPVRGIVRTSTGAIIRYMN